MIGLKEERVVLNVHRRSLVWRFGTTMTKRQVWYYLYTKRYDLASLNTQAYRRKRNKIDTFFIVETFKLINRIIGCKCRQNRLIMQRKMSEISYRFLTHLYGIDY